MLYAVHFLPLLILLQQPLPSDTDYTARLWTRIGLTLLAVVASIFMPNRRSGYLGWTGSGFSWQSGRGWGLGNARHFAALDPYAAGPVPGPAAGLTPQVQSLVAGARVQQASDAYQAQLAAWLLQQGLDAANPQHVARAMQAVPYNPALYSAAAAPAPAAPGLAAQALGLGWPEPPAPPVPAGPVLDPPQQVQELLWMYGGPWWVAGGWALDLWRGARSRAHGDIEIAVPRSGQLALRAYLTQFRFTQAVRDEAGTARREPLGAEQAAEPPVHELHARRYSGAGADPQALIELEVLLNEVEDGTWAYRRDARVTLPAEQLGGLSADGIPYLAPEVVLLYKAGSSAGLRPVDEQDFAQALPDLAPAQRAWLKLALDTAHPGHPWSARL